MGLRGKQKEQAAFIAEKLNYLFENVMSPSGRSYTLEAIQAATGIHASYIGKLRSGKVANPGRDVLAALSDFFGVKPDYWFQTKNQLTSPDPRAQQISILHRQIEQANLSAEQIKFIQQLVETMRQMPLVGMHPVETNEPSASKGKPAQGETESDSSSESEG